VSFWGLSLTAFVRATETTGIADLSLLDPVGRVTGKLELIGMHRQFLVCRQSIHNQKNGAKFPLTLYTDKFETGGK
jgi:hypothetical protein